MGLVSESSNSVRSRIKPALHVGEQIGGGFGCRACAGSAGMAGGTTTGGGDDGDTVAQPLASISSGISISAGALQGFMGFIGDFLHLCGAALFFGAGRLYGQPGGCLSALAVLGPLRHGLGVLALLGGESVGLNAQRDYGQRQRRGRHPCHLVTAFCATLPAM